MKLLVCTLFIITQMLNTTTLFAKIWRINNTGIPADYTSPSLAIAAAAVKNGDTLHIEPSGISYGNFDVTKRLTIIGNGYFLGLASSNLNPNLQAYTAVSPIGEIGVGVGGSGSVIMGLTATNVYIAGDNVIFKRNHVQILQAYKVDQSTTGIQFIQNYVAKWMGGIFGAHSNMVITNNIIVGFVDFNGNDNGIFTNNVVVNNNVVGNQSASYGAIVLHNFIVRNNIKVQNNQGVGLINCTIQNNTDCTGATGFGTTNGNTGNVNMGNVFVGWPTLGAFSEDGRFALKNGSPAIGTGFGGSDRGALLTSANANNNLADTYVLSGMPNVPSIFRFDAPATTSSSTMNVTISTRTNQ